MGHQNVPCYNGKLRVLPEIEKNLNCEDEHSIWRSLSLTIKHLYNNFGERPKISQFDSPLILRLHPQPFYI